MIEIKYECLNNFVFFDEQHLRYVVCRSRLGGTSNYHHREAA